MKSSRSLPIIKRKSWGSALALTLCALWLPVSGFAEQAPTVGSSLVEKQLPASADERPRILNSASAEREYRELLIAPLADWLKEEQFAIRAARDLGFDWQYHNAWVEGSKTNAIYLLLGEQGQISRRSEFRLAKGHPFGGWKQIESAPEQERAKRILWNVQFNSMIAGATLYGVRLDWVGEQRLLRSAKGVLYQSFEHPEQLLAGEDGNSSAGELQPQTEPQASAPILHEVLRLFSPPVVYGYTQVGRRFSDEREGKLWIFSPVTGRVREVFDSNRSDGILGSSLAFDDLFVWNADGRKFDVELLGSKRLLVPFPSSSMQALEVRNATPLPGDEDGEVATSERLPTVRLEGESRGGEVMAAVWNHQVQRFPKQSAWVPTSARFVPRDVWVLKLHPLDPFYETGSIVLVVDKQSMLPVYKIVHGLDGSYQKTVVGGWGLAIASDKQQSLPYLAFQFVKENSSAPALALTSLYVHILPKKHGNVHERLVQLRELNFPAIAEKEETVAADSIDETADLDF